MKKRYYWIIGIVCIVLALFISWCFSSLFQSIESDASIEYENTCKSVGGIVKTQLCCQSVVDFPDMCLIGACGCSPTNSHEIKVCDCGEGKCWDATAKACISNSNP